MRLLRMSRLLSVEDSLHRSKVSVTPLSFVERRISEIKSVDLLEVSVLRLVEVLRHSLRYI